MVDTDDDPTQTVFDEYVIRNPQKMLEEATGPVFHEINVLFDPETKDELEDLIRSYVPQTQLMKEQWQNMGLPPAYGHVFTTRINTERRKEQETII